jgi:DeoR family fructose operon transcriptional repressor
VEEKKAIARYAASIIHDDDFVYIDSGSSTGWLIEYLEPTKATFVTNGIAHVKRLMSKNLRAYLIGGLAKPVTESIVGADAVNNMKKYNFTKCFLGTNGIHTDYGFTTIDVEDALVKMEAVNRSYASIVLADHTKFDKVTAVTFAGLKKSSIITDRLMNDKYADVALVTEVAR